MANWFPMALKDDARSWLLNPQHGSISSWDEMRDRFIANFQGTRDRPPALGDLRCIKQQPGETLQKYIQCFNNTRLKIPKVTDEAIISALLAANELLRYRPVDDLYEEWLDRVAELVRATGGSPAPSLSLPHPPPATGDVAHGAPPPPLPQYDALAPRRAAPRHDPP